MKSNCEEFERVYDRSYTWDIPKTENDDDLKPKVVSRKGAFQNSITTIASDYATGEPEDQKDIVQ